MAIIPTNNKTVDIEAVHITVTCPNPTCKTQFGISIKRPQQQKNCYCGAGMFEIETHATRGKIMVDVTFVWDNTKREPLEPDNIEILDQ